MVSNRTVHRRPAEAVRLLLEIDAEILRSYDLPPALEREVLDMFQGLERPVPFTFTAYYPKGFDAYLPLHELISPQFEDARADRLLGRLVFIADQEISDAMAMLRGDYSDEELPS